jgi:hypothetical protein
MNGTTHVGESATGWQYLRCNGGVGTVESEMGILEANVRGCDWRCN